MPLGMLNVFYADSDFFLAIIKKADWLKPSASELLKKYKGKIWTSGYSVAEILLISEELSLDQERIVSSIYQIARVVALPENIAKRAAHYMRHKNLTTFDALHAAYCDKDTIISSDSVFDELGFERIKLGK